MPSALQLVLYLIVVFISVDHSQRPWRQNNLQDFSIARDEPGPVKIEVVHFGQPCAAKQRKAEMTQERSEVASAQEIATQQDRIGSKS